MNKVYGGILAHAVNFYVFYKKNKKGIIGNLSLY